MNDNLAVNLLLTDEDNTQIVVEWPPAEPASWWRVFMARVDRRRAVKQLNLLMLDRMQHAPVRPG